MVATLYTLSSETESALMAAADAIESGWQVIGAIAIREREAARTAGVPVMAVYERIGQAARGASKSTVRQYAWLAERIDGDMLIEFPQFGFDVWRRIAMHAAKNGATVTDVAIACANGSAITADAIAAKLRGDLDKPEPYQRALERTLRALASAMRHAPDKTTIARLMKMSKTIEEMTK